MPRFLPSEWQKKPLANVWLGTSVEDRLRAQERISKLASVSATVRFLSCEPLLESLDDLDLSAVDWVIVGGESGPRARRMAPEWVGSIRRQCAASGTAFFFKQAGTVLAEEWGMTGKGGHEFGLVPDELRVRDYPLPRRAEHQVTSEDESLRRREPQLVAAW